MRKTAFLLVVLGLAACGAPSTSAPTPVASTARPASSTSAPPPSTAAFGAKDVDRMLQKAWKEASLVPAKPADDATWLRRVHFDVAGTPPSPEEARAFAADTSPDKRAKKVEELLASPAYADHWTSYWDDELIGKEAKDARLDRAQFRAWLHGRFAANASWDSMVTELVAGTGQNGEGGPRTQLVVDMPMADSAADKADKSGATAAAGPVNGAVNYLLHFATPQDLAGASSRTFLGVQIQCAQCHDHKTEKWKQDDFRKLTATFLHAEVDPIDKGQVKGIRRVMVGDYANVPPRLAKKEELGPIVAAKPTALDGTPLDKGKESRKALAAWMTSPKNEWFAKAYVNRMWAHFLGRGFVNPVDDIRPSNPTVAPEILDALAKDFAAGGFDPKKLIRTICASEAYGLSSGGGENLGPDNLLWGRFRIVPLGPEELLNHLFAATRLERAAESAKIQNLPLLKAQLARSYQFLFDVDEVEDARDFEGSVTQALTLLNGSVVGYGTRSIPGTALAEILAAPGDDASKVDALYLRVLARRPTDAERARALAFVQEGEKRPAPAETDAPKAPEPTKRDQRALKKAGKKGVPMDTPQLGKLGRKSTADGHTRAFEDLFFALLTSSESLENH